MKNAQQKPGVFCTLDSVVRATLCIKRFVQTVVQPVTQQATADVVGLDKIYAEVFGCEAAFVRHSIVSGTHALTIGLFGAIVAIPIAGCIKVLIEEYPTIRKIRAA